MTDFTAVLDLCNAGGGKTPKHILSLDFYSGGVEWYDNQQGNSVKRAEAYNSKDYWGFGKANGLGDLEWVCGDTAYRGR